MDAPQEPGAEPPVWHIVMPSTEPGYPVTCARCDRELVMASQPVYPVVCRPCWDLYYEIRQASRETGLKFGV